jgi:orotate phosphoribosyltransferase
MLLVSTMTMTTPRASADQSADQETLIELLAEFALEKGDFMLSGGDQAKYIVDAKRVVMRLDGFRVIGRLIADRIAEHQATAVGGLTLGADPIAYAALAAGANVKAFVVRKEPKEHGLQQQVEGPPLEATDRCLVVDDVVTTGKSTITAIKVLGGLGFTICGVVSLLDRLAGGGDAIRQAIDGAPYVALTTIDDVYPERPDRD